MKEVCESSLVYMRDCSQILTVVFFTFSIYFRNKKMYTISGLLFKRKEGRIMLETDTQLDDFKDDMIEITEEDMKKISGGLIRMGTATQKQRKN